MLDLSVLYRYGRHIIIDDRPLPVYDTMTTIRTSERAAGIAGRRPDGLEALEDRLLLSAAWVDPALNASGDSLTADDVVIEAGVEPVQGVFVAASGQIGRAHV